MQTNNKQFAQRFHAGRIAAASNESSLGALRVDCKRQQEQYGIDVLSNPEQCYSPLAPVKRGLQVKGLGGEERHGLHAQSHVRKHAP